MIPPFRFQIDIRQIIPVHKQAVLSHRKLGMDMIMRGIIDIVARGDVFPQIARRVFIIRLDDLHIENFFDFPVAFYHRVVQNLAVDFFRRDAVPRLLLCAVPLRQNGKGSAAEILCLNSCRRPVDFRFGLLCRGRICVVIGTLCRRGGFTGTAGCRAECEQHERSDKCGLFFHDIYSFLQNYDITDAIIIHDFFAKVNSFYHFYSDIRSRLENRARKEGAEILFCKNGCMNLRCVV